MDVITPPTFEDHGDRSERTVTGLARMQQFFYRLDKKFGGMLMSSKAHIAITAPLL
jgi:hypothetical protein